MAVNIHLHRTGAIGTTARDLAYNTLESMDDDLDHNFLIDYGMSNLDNSQAPGTDSSARFDWLAYLEHTLHNAGYLDSSNLHVVLYNESSGAGFAQFNWNGTSDEGGYWNYKSYRTYGLEDGLYGIANINTSTRHWPYTDEWYESTVIHEVGHLFNVDHEHGAIRQNSSGDNYASPMCTWYVEQDCESADLTGGNGKPSDDLCRDDSGSKDGCYHWQQMSGCTISNSNTWINNHS